MISNNDTRKTNKETNTNIKKQPIIYILQNISNKRKYTCNKGSKTTTNQTINRSFHPPSVHASMNQLIKVKTNKQTNKQTSKEANNIAPTNQTGTKQENKKKQDTSTEIIESTVSTSTFSKSQQAYCTPARSHQETFKQPYPKAIYNISGQVYTTCFVGNLNK